MQETQIQSLGQEDPLEKILYKKHAGGSDGKEPLFGNFYFKDECV